MAEEKKEQPKKKEEPKAEAKAAETAKPEAKKEEKPTVETAPVKGLLGTKIGMTRVFVDENEMVPVTVVSSEGIVVSQVKTKETDGYNAVQVAYGDIEERKVNKPMKNHFSKKKVPFKRNVFEFRVDDIAPFKVGQTVPVSVFEKGEWVQASGLSKGKGFAGTIKRFGFGGGPHSHGHGEYRRSPGSSGGQGPQHVLPGTRKPGHKGNVWTTVPVTEVVDVDTDKSLVLIKGSIPGPNGNFVVIRPSSRKKGVKTDKKAGKAKGKK